MERLAYELVEIKVWEMTSSIGKAYSIEEAARIMDEIDDYLILCGWSPPDFWAETESRVDADWDPKSCLN